MAQAEVRQTQEQHKLPSLGCGANSTAGHLARSIWSQQAEMPGCSRSTWWVTQEPSWQDQERGQPRNKESVSSFPVSPALPGGVDTSGEGSPCVRSDCEMTGLIPPRSWPACLSEHGVLKGLSSYVTLCDVLVASSPGLETA